MNGDRHTQILESYFWHFVDRGDPSADTPLFTGIHEGDPLAQVIATGIRPSLREAESAIEIARKEVAL